MTVQEFCNETDKNTLCVIKDNGKIVETIRINDTATFRISEKSKNARIESTTYGTIGIKTSCGQTTYINCLYIDINTTNVCDYCSKDCKCRNIDSEKNCQQFNPDNKFIILLTTPENPTYYCKLSFIKRTWLHEKGLDMPSYTNPDNPVNKEIYQTAEKEDEILYSTDVYSSRQYNKTTDGEWFALDKNGRKIVYITKKETDQGFMFKDINAYENKTERICYVPEFDAIKTTYSYNDFIKIAENNEDVANFLFETVNWQMPESVLEECLDNQTIYRCEKCGKIYMPDWSQRPVCRKCDK